MKRYARLIAVLGGIGLIASICQEPREPQAPTLVSPEEASIFETLPPTFVWSAEPLAEDYVIRIYMGSATDIQDTLGDTSYAMAQEVFDNLADGTYKWLVAARSESGELFWSDERSFVVDKLQEPTGLDTTYFPLGLGYEWCYEQYNYRFSDEDSPMVKTWYDTFTVIVIDSFGQSNSLQFLLEGAFMDLSNPVKVLGDEIEVWGVWDASADTIPLIPPESTWTDWQYLRTTYEGDILCLESSFDPWGNDNEWVAEDIIRKRGIGTIQQLFDAGHSSGMYYNFTSDRLLWFYNGRDTVYKAEGSGG